jgi:hypothetical protein
LFESEFTIECIVVSKIDNPTWANISMTSSGADVEWQKIPIIDTIRLHFWFVLIITSGKWWNNGKAL